MRVHCRVLMEFNLSVIIAYVCCSITVIGIDCVSINFFSSFDPVNWCISDTFLFKVEKKVHDVSTLQAVTLQYFLKEVV